MEYNQIKEITTYTYDINNNLIQTESIKTIEIFNYFYLCFKIGLLIWAMFYVYKKIKNK